MLLVREKSSIQAFLVSEEKGMQQRRVPHCSPSSHQVPLARPQQHVKPTAAKAEMVQCGLQDSVFVSCPGKAVLSLADSQRARETISSLNKLPKAAKPTIKDRGGSIIIIKYARTQCDFLFYIQD